MSLRPVVVVEVTRHGAVLEPHGWNGESREVELRGALEHHAACALDRQLRDPRDVATDFPPERLPSDRDLL